MLKKWVDVDPMDWFYRAVLESDMIKPNKQDQSAIINSYTYGIFEPDYPRKVYTFVTEENQTKFDCPGYKAHKDNQVYMYIDSVLTSPSKTEDGAVYIANPIAGGIEVVVICYGIPKMVPLDGNECALRPVTHSCDWTYPSYELEKMDDYIHDYRYVKNEKVVCMGKSLQRVNVDLMPGETIQKAIYRVIGTKRDYFTIIDGILYVSFNLNDIPVKVFYNYVDPASGKVKYRTNEPGTPHSDCAVYSDRFFQNTVPMKYEFYVILNRIRENIYNRFTDREYEYKNPALLNRYIADKSTIVGKWYEQQLLDLLEEKFLDGCYVFPLYEDDTFDATACMTRAEMVVALSRFTEWALEKFR